MTRAERLDRAAARAKAQLEAQRKALAQIQAAQYAEEKKARTKRRLVVGELADQAGLFALDDTTLAGLFALLAPLVHVPDPVAVLAVMLNEVDGSPGTVVPGCAHRGGGISARYPPRPPVSAQEVPRWPICIFARRRTKAVARLPLGVSPTLHDNPSMP